MKKYFIILVAFFLLSGVFCVKAQVSETNTVNISALVPEGSGGGGGGFIPPDNIFPAISDIAITEITLNSVNISWTTNELAVPQINYGKTSDYEKTFIGESFTIDNSIFLENLLPDTIYYFEIVAIDRVGNRTSSGDLVFETLCLFDIIPLANAGNFVAESFDGRIVLSWKNPPDDNFAGVQINRRIDFPALSIGDGEIIYSGADESFIDVEIEDKIKYFYTAFSYNDLSNFSSGAIASAVGIKSSEPQPPIPPDPAEPVEPPEPPVVFPFDVEDLEAVPDPEDKKIIVKWDNPADENFKEVEIYKSKDFPPLIYGEGELIYKGKRNSFEDLNVEKEIVYYYTAFTKDKDGNYSAGKTVTGTFKEFPISPTAEIKIDDINFIASDKALLLPKDKNNKIYIFAGNETSVYYDAKNLPKTLKTILITVGGHSHILNSDEKKEFYKTKFISPKIAGNYPVVISVLDFKHGEIYQAKAEMEVMSYGKIYELKDSNYESKSFLREIVFNIKYQALSIFNKEGVLDLDKIGVEGAKITLYKFDEENNEWRLWNAEKYNQGNSQFTDKNGKFGSVTPDGKYKIVAEKEGYNFYSEIIEVENNIINSEIKIKGKTDWKWMILVVIVLGILIGQKRLRKKKRKNIQ